MYVGPILQTPSDLVVVNFTTFLGNLLTLNDLYSDLAREDSLMALVCNATDIDRILDLFPEIDRSLAHSVLCGVSPYQWARDLEAAGLGADNIMHLLIKVSGLFTSSMQ